MNLRKLRPRHRKHFRRGIQLHRAGAERNHRSREREVARFEPLDVAEHFGLAVVAVEDGMLKEGRSRGADCGISIVFAMITSKLQFSGLHR